MHVSQMARHFRNLRHMPKQLASSSRLKHTSVCVCVCEYAKGDCATMQEEGVKPVCELPNSNDMDKKFKSAKRAVEHHTGRTSSKAVDTQPSPAKSLPERSPSQSGRPIHVQSLLGQSKAT